jgi:deoxycytidine triphosphate deaminase
LRDTAEFLRVGAYRGIFPNPEDRPHDLSRQVDVRPLEWEGHVTLEFSNTTPLPAKIYANEGVAQMLFLESDEACETSYKDRGGKYQGQTGVTLPKA